MVSDIDLRFTDNEISPWGGLSVMFKMLERCGMNEALSSCPLPQQGSNCGYSPKQLIYGLFASVWCGASCFDQLEIVRHDGCLRKILGWEQGAGHRAYIRYFDKFTQADNQRVFDHLYGWFFQNLQFDNYTLDFDSTVEQRCGEQEGAAKGYNPKRFWANEACANFIIMAYNLYALFRLVLTNNKKHPFLKKIRYELLAIPGYLRKSKDKVVLYLARSMTMRKAFKGIWKTMDDLDLPYVV